MLTDGRSNTLLVSFVGRTLVAVVASFWRRCEPSGWHQLNALSWSSSLLLLPPPPSLLLLPMPALEVRASKLHECAVCTLASERGHGPAAIWFSRSPEIDADDENDAVGNHRRFHISLRDCEPTPLGQRPAGARDRALLVFALERLCWHWRPAQHKGPRFAGPQFARVVGWRGHLDAVIGVPLALCALGRPRPTTCSGASASVRERGRKEGGHQTDSMALPAAAAAATRSPIK